MKKSILKMAVPTLALGLAFAPMANVSAHETSQKTVVSVKTVTKTSVTVNKHLSAKEKEAIKKLASITKNTSKVEASVTKLATATTSFYTKAATTPVSVKAEADFYSSTSGKLKANTNQLKALKKQVDHVAKKYKNTSAVTAAYKQIAELNSAISAATKNLNDLHAQFKTTLSEQEAKERFTTITNQLTKVETSVTELSKATVDFYAKNTTVDAVTVKAEADFYRNTDSKLRTNAVQLEALKKQLDYVAKYYKDANAIAAANTKITDLKTKTTTASKTLNDLHTQFVAKVNEQKAKEQLVFITNETSKVEASVAALLKTTTEFYAKANVDPSGTVKAEADFYTNTARQLKINTTQLETLKKQLDAAAKVSKDAVAVAAADKKISEVKATITATSKILNDLHTQFAAKVKEQEVKAKLTTITNEISKVEAITVALSKATVDFYAKAATDASVTVKVENEFYTKTSDSLLTNTKQLLVVKKQLDSFVKIYGQSADVTAAYSKFTAQNQAITVALETLIKLHTNFKPVVTTTNP
jgi:myosin heavy subunit